MTTGAPLPSPQTLTGRFLLHKSEVKSPRMPEIAADNIVPVLPAAV